MLNLFAEDITQILAGAPHQVSNNVKLNYICFDTRDVPAAVHQAVFVALQDRRDGHYFIEQAYELGIRNFLISRADTPITTRPDVNYWLSTISELSGLIPIAKYKRSIYTGTVVGITGSNGKTIVKEYIDQILNQLNINHYVSPGSYNSLLGVTYSIAMLNLSTEYSIIEAGISHKGDMDKLEEIIKPDIGIISSIGDAHLVNFNNKEELNAEKYKLFKDSKRLFLNNESPQINDSNAEITLLQLNNEAAEVQYHQSNITSAYRAGIVDFKISLVELNRNHNVESWFVNLNSDGYFYQNISLALCFIFSLPIDKSKAVAAANQIIPLQGRMRFTSAINGSTLLTDIYSGDLFSISNSIYHLLNNGKNNSKLAIFSFSNESKIDEKELQNNLKRFENKGITAIYIGPNSINLSPYFFSYINYPNVEVCLTEYPFENIKQCDILIKGPANIYLNKIAERLQNETHNTILDIDLTAMVDNLRVYRKLIPNSTKLMAMVKAYSYGAGSYEIATTLARHSIDYLAVAYVDEGVELRKQVHQLPIMVMNVNENAFAALVRNHLEPEIYSISQLVAFVSFLQSQPIEMSPIKIHLKLETGMNRLGITTNEIPECIQLINSCNLIHVQSIMSHLSSSDQLEYHEFTMLQIFRFNIMASQIIDAFNYPITRHILNSTGIANYGGIASYEMVRLGIGLYGIDPSEVIDSQLIEIGTLTSQISQIKNVSIGESVGYSRGFIAGKEMKIATIPIGYADGLKRSAGKGKFSVKIGDYLAPTVGNICMDMCMIDITNIPTVKENDQVLIFGPEYSVKNLSQACNTIPYEILAGISQRVKRRYKY